MFTEFAEQAIKAANIKECQFFLNKALESTFTYEDLAKIFHPDLIREWLPKECSFTSEVTNPFVLKRLHQALKNRWHNDKVKTIYNQFIKSQFADSAYQELTKRGVIINKEHLTSLYALYLFEETRQLREG